MLTDSLQQKIHESMKAGDQVRTTTLKLLYTALHNAEIAKIGKLSEEEELKIVTIEVKKRKDAIEIYNSAQDQEKAHEKALNEEAELTILMEYMPKQIDEAELSDIVNEVISQISPAGMQDMGKVIGAVKAKVGNAADGALIAELVKKNLLQN